MTTKDFTANVISATKVVPDGNFKDSKASGVWDINEALDLIKGGNWPNAANINPAAFVDALFQCHLYTGTGSDQTITNEIDLSGKGGMVWIKGRNATSNHALVDTVRGGANSVASDTTAAERTDGAYGLTFNSTGFISTGGNLNVNGREQVSWTFRKQPKFFDIVTYTGNATNRTISHSLGSVPGMILVKDLSGTGAWAVYHRSVGNGAGQNYVLNLSTTAGDASGVWNGTSPTSSVFTVGTDGTVNESGRNFVAYLFAHHDDDGGFGVAGDQDIIKCGHFDTNSSEEATIDLGFEPQWVFYKRYNSSTEGDWLIYDSMRGMQGDFLSQAALLEANTSDAEDATTNRIAVTSTGFKVDNWGTSSSPFIFVAIRRGGMQTPTAASSVFHAEAGSNSDDFTYNAGFPVDMMIYKERTTINTGWGFTWDRLRGSNYLRTNDTNAETAYTSGGNPAGFDEMTFVNVVGQTTNDKAIWNWKRARGYFDFVAYTGTGSNRTITHNLGAVPEMMWVKKRSAANNWKTFHANLGGTKSMELNTTVAAETNGSALFNSTAPTASVFSLGTAGDTNGNGATYIAYLFATVAGVSKVGSFTQSGATNVDCGFTGDTPSFILLKRTDGTGDWLTFDSVRGIVAGNDKSLDLNNTDAEVTNADVVDPYSGGFATTSSLTNGDYMFYAIAAIS
jgi:hypothetical protein